MADWGGRNSVLVRFEHVSMMDWAEGAWPSYLGMIAFTSACDIGLFCLYRVEGLPCSPVILCFATKLPKQHQPTFTLGKKV